MPTPPCGWSSTTRTRSSASAPATVVSFQGDAGSDPTNSLQAGGRVYVASRNTNAVLVLDPKTLEPTQDSIGVGLNPFALVADDRSIWVTGLGDNTLTQIRYR